VTRNVDQFPSLSRPPAQSPAKDSAAPVRVPTSSAEQSDTMAMIRRFILA
jgi:hypothetical protein